MKLTELTYLFGAMPFEDGYSWEISKKRRTSQKEQKRKKKLAKIARKSRKRNRK